MTQQIPDTCQFEGRSYAIEAWIGDTDCIPSSETLGFDTETVHTANWSGRIDHFQVCGDKLYLFKIEVNLTDAEHHFNGQHLRREVQLRYEPMHTFDRQGERIEVREYRSEFLIYDDLVVPFTGLIQLASAANLWELPAAEDEADVPIYFRELRFVEGELIDPERIRENELLELLDDESTDYQRVVIDDV